MAKKKSAAVKKVASKRKKVAVKKATAKKAMPKRKKSAVKKAASTPAKPKSSVHKPAAIKKKVAKKKVAVRFASIAKPTKETTVKAVPQVQPLVCDWTLSDIRAVYQQETMTTHFHYTRTNPRDARVVIMYASSMGGVPDNTINDPKDHGNGDCSGTARDWDADEIIPAGYAFSVQLFEGTVPMTPAHSGIVG